jgi:hypothetical protein
MLERVGIGQTRFNLPGLSVDGRGAALGRQWLARFGALDRLVSFLRIWSAEQLLDDLQPGLRILQVRRDGGTREVLLVFPVASSASADAAARAARLAGGQCFTGHGKHFVQVRDGRAPLGYDVAGLESVPGADFVLYSTDGTTSHVIVAELPLEKLLLRLELQRDLGASARIPAPTTATTPATSLSAREEGGGQPPTWLVQVRRGLGPRLLEYLLRVQQRAPELGVFAGLCDEDSTSRFERATSFWLFRLERVPRRVLQVLARTPGMTLLVPVAERIAVAFGYRHPIALSGCRTWLSSDRLYLFAPPPRGVTTVIPVPTLTPIADLVRLHESPTLSLAHEVPATVLAHMGEHSVLRTPLRLEAAPNGGGAPAAATLVPWRQAGWLRALSYAMPPSALQHHRLAVLARGILVVGPAGQTGPTGPAGDPTSGAGTRAGIEGIPFGQLFHAPVPGLLVPIGRCLRPAIPPALLAERLRAVDGAVVVFPGTEEPGPGGEPAFRVLAEALRPFEARILADLKLREVPVDRDILPRAPVEADSEIEIENQSVGFLPLWRLGR